jgi:hypothetical protein
MKLRKIILIAVSILFFSFLTACSNTSVDDFTIKDMVVYLDDEPTKIEITYTKKEYPISYRYDKTKLRIVDNYIECFSVGEYSVIADGKEIQKEFKVTALHALEIDDTYTWVGYPDVELTPILNIDEEVRYETDSKIIEINGNKVKALEPGESLVKAIAGRFEKEFMVLSLTPQRESQLYYWKDNWLTKAVNYQNEYAENGTNGKSTIFIGDSFFDPFFFKTFNTYYGSKDAFCFGISSSTSNTWEMLFKDLNADANNQDNSYFKEIKPKNIVIQLGNNNIYANGRLAKYAAIDLQAFLTLIHGLLPDTKVYLFAVTPRATREELREITLEFNLIMNRYATTKPWLVYLDTTDKMTSDKLFDGIHPAPEHYIIFVEALENAGIELEEK